MNVFNVLREKIKEKYEKVNPYVGNNVIEIINEVEKEFVPDIYVGNIDFCKWEYDGVMYDRCPHKETLFARIHNCDEKIFTFCPYCGTEIKVIK